MNVKDIIFLGTYLWPWRLSGRADLSWEEVPTNSWCETLWTMSNECCWKAAQPSSIFITSWLFCPIPPAPALSKITGHITGFILVCGSQSALNPELDNIKNQVPQKRSLEHLLSEHDWHVTLPWGSPQRTSGVTCWATYFPSHHSSVV